MAQSYIPAGTNVICTEMTSGSPAQLGITRDNVMVYCNEGEEPLLNTMDKKLSCAMQCRIKQSFFTGLGNLMVGLALGALAVAAVAFVAAATVATGGAALALAGTVALMVSGVAAAGSLASSGVALAYKYIANECDCSLSGKWELVHDRVYIQGENALLQKSILNCPKGGVISLVMDDIKARQVARQVSDLNNKIMNENAWSKFKQGLIGNGANVFGAWSPEQVGGSVFGLVIGTGLSVYDYCNEADKIGRDENMLMQQQYAHEMLTTNSNNIDVNEHLWTNSNTRDIGVSTTYGVASSGIGATKEVVLHNRSLMNEVTNLGNEALQGLTEGNYQAWRELSWAQDAAIADLATNSKGLKDIGKGVLDGMWKGTNKWYTLGGIGTGIAAAIINNTIENEANMNEDNIYKKIIERINRMRIESSKNINIIAES